MNFPSLSKASPLQVRVYMDREWQIFVARLPLAVGDDGASRPVFSHPRQPGGLPEGWHVRWSTPYQGMNPAGGYEMFLIERDNGGWTIAFHLTTLLRPDFPKTNLWEGAASSFEELYERVTSGQRPVLPHTTETTLSGFILPYYDLTDPTEAAEATLVGLGAPATVLPRALVGADGN